MTEEKLNRRDFILGAAKSAAAVSATATVNVSGATGLILGFDLVSQQVLAGTTSASGFPNPWLRIEKSGITFVLDKVEMGQGVNTALAMIIAEELDVALEDIKIESALANRVYIQHSALGAQMTGGSTSVKSSWEPLKVIAATARQMLLLAGAKSWSVNPQECRTELGVVYHDNTGRKMTYKDLAEAAASLPPPEPVFKDPKTYRYIGKSTPRVDLNAKVTGKQNYGIDTVLPNMLVAVIVRCPVLGGKLKSFDDTAAKASQGVKHVIALPAGVAILANTYWQARKGAELLQINWDNGEFVDLSSAKIQHSFEALSKTNGKQVRNDGDVEAGVKSAVKTIEGFYETPYLAHATMEPQNCVARITKSTCEVWAPTQAPGIAMEVARMITGLSPDQIKINTTAIGGGFGRRLVTDYVAEAVTLAAEVDVPVKVMWSREDDLQNDFYRPATYNVLKGGIDAEGKPVFWQHRIVSPAILAHFIPHAIGAMLPQWFPPALAKIFGKAAGAGFKGLLADETSTEGARDVRYRIPNITVDYQHIDPGVPVGFWRSVGHSNHGFMVEGFIDELAHLSSSDPYRYRQSLLPQDSRNRRVLDRVAQESGWDKPAPKGVFRGIAQHESFGSFCAQVVEISLQPGGELKIHRIVAAIDCGPVVNPDGVRAQVEGAIIFGLSAALYGEITVNGGRIQQSNFHDYPVVRMKEAPIIETHIIQSEHPVSGIGEPAVPPVAPALANAIFAATGQRIRSLPLKWKA